MNAGDEPSGAVPRGSWLRWGGLAVTAGPMVVSKYVAAGLGLATQILAARLLGPESYGAVTLVLAYPSLLWALSNVKPIAVTTRYVVAFRETGSTGALRSLAQLGFLIDLAGAAVTVVLVGVTAFWAAEHVLRLPDAAPLLMVFTASFVPQSLSGTGQAILAGAGRFSTLAWLDVVQAVLRGAGTVAPLVAGMGVAGMVVGLAVAQALFGLLTLAAAAGTLTLLGAGGWWRQRERGLGRLARELAGSLGWNYLLVTLNGLFTQVPVLVLGRFQGPAAAGLFRLASTIVTAASYVEHSLGRVAYTRLAELWTRGAVDAAGAALRGWFRRTGLPLGGLLLLTIPLAPAGVGLLFGDRYQGLAGGLQVMLVGAAAAGAFFWLNASYFSAGAFGPWTIGYGAQVAFVLLFVVPVAVWWSFLGCALLVTAARIGHLIVMERLRPRVVAGRLTGAGRTFDSAAAAGHGVLP